MVVEPEIHPKHRPLRHECITLIPAIYGWEQIEREYLGPRPTPERPSPAAQTAQVRGAPGIDPGLRQSHETKQEKTRPPKQERHTTGNKTPSRRSHCRTGSACAARHFLSVCLFPTRRRNHLLDRRQHNHPSHGTAHPWARHPHAEGAASMKNDHPLQDGRCDFCGAKGIRTPDPLHAMEMRYQLRHSPVLNKP